MIIYVISNYQLAYGCHQEWCQSSGWLWWYEFLIDTSYCGSTWLTRDFHTVCKYHSAPVGKLVVVPDGVVNEASQYILKSKWRNSKYLASLQTISAKLHFSKEKHFAIQVHYPARELWPLSRDGGSNVSLRWVALLVFDNLRQTVCGYGVK